MRALVTNDDGVESEGLGMLALAAHTTGLDVTVVAPSFDASGTSASMTAVADDGRVLVEAVRPGPWGSVLGVHGPPAFIVRAAMFGAFGPPPDVVLSGVNRGRNTGRAVLHSGTVAAALTASTYGRRGLAVSAEVGDHEQWAPDGATVADALLLLLDTPETTVLNVNLPAPSRPCRGFRPARLAEAGTVQGGVTEVGGGYVPVTFADSDDPPAEGTDAAALIDGFAPVTAIRAVTEDSRIDLGEILARPVRGRRHRREESRGPGPRRGSGPVAEDL